MTHRSIPFVAGLMLAGTLVAGSSAAGSASAQEAIMLETIGAVRMVRPEEVKRVVDAAVPAQQRVAVPAPAVPERHAAALD